MKMCLSCFALGVLLFSGAIADEQQSDAAYKEMIADFRNHFFDKFLDKEYSPIRTSDDLAKVRYYPADINYRIQCAFENSTDDEDPVKMITTTGGEAPFVRYAWLKFRFGGADHKLAVYKRVYDGPDFFFIPFKDLTNGDTTYGGGRYLGFEMKDVDQGKVLIDFNKAYNPWCHYDEKLACPLPPDENFLQLAIPAGEKLYKGAKKTL